jgi:hypothetical protein
LRLSSIRFARCGKSTPPSQRSNSSLEPGNAGPLRSGGRGTSASGLVLLAEPSMYFQKSSGLGSALSSTSGCLPAALCSSRNASRLPAANAMSCGRRPNCRSTTQWCMCLRFCQALCG